MLAGMRRAGFAIITALFFVFSGVPASAAQPEGEWWRAALRVPELHSITTGSGALVAVVDSGVDGSLPALSDALETGTDFTGLGEDGLVDHDEDMHGTGTALIIAGQGSGAGLGGIAPSASILPIAVTGGRMPAPDQLSEAIRYAVERGADVINMSIGTNVALFECPERAAAAVRFAISNDVVLVAAAGNEQRGAHEFPGSCPGVLTVGATDPNKRPWEKSHRGDHVDLAAPGVGIASIGSGSQIGIADGTSNSSALVAGVAALIRAHYPEASADEVVTRLIATAEDLEEPGHDKATGYGLVQPYDALTADIPAGTENPVYAGLDLTDTEDPGPGPPPRETLAPPSIAAPPVASGGGGGVSPVLVIVPVVAVLVLATAALVTVLAIRARRRRNRFEAPPGYGYPGT